MTPRPPFVIGMIVPIADGAGNVKLSVYTGCGWVDFKGMNVWGDIFGHQREQDYRAISERLNRVFRRVILGALLVIGGAGSGAIFAFLTR